MENVDRELARLAPYAENGAVAGRKRIDLEYERSELAARADLAEQELLVRGLTAAQVAEVRDARRLVDTVVVRLTPTPRLARTESAGGVRPVSYQQEAAAPTADEMTIETVRVSPGEAVARGATLCELAYHRTLFVVGHAFEADIAAVTEAAAADRTVDAEFGEERHDGKTVTRDGLPIRFIAGHVDPETQTYQVYATLPNESVQTRRDVLGRRYRTWRYKVGQRAHLLIPTATLAEQIVLPREAVVTEGPDAYVFREHDEEHEAPHDEGAEDPDHADGEHEDDEHHEEIALEVEPVPVVVLERTADRVVVQRGGELAVGDPIAMNAGYQLFLAWKAMSEGGGGHHHHHH